MEDEKNLERKVQEKYQEELRKLQKTLKENREVLEDVVKYIQAVHFLNGTLPPDKITLQNLSFREGARNVVQLLEHLTRKDV